MSNFEFLKADYPILFQLGSFVEKYLYDDPDSSIYKLGKLSETIVNYMFELDNIKAPEYDNTHAKRISLLNREGMIPKQIDNILFTLRKKRNKAVHAVADNIADGKTMLTLAWQLSVWFMEVYGSYSFISPEFELPRLDSVQPSEKEKEEQDVLIEKLYNEAQMLPQPIAAKDKRLKISFDIANKIKLSEAETRILIDAQLNRVGWEADTSNLRHSKGTRPEKGRNIAISEFPVKGGYVDYAFFAGLTLVAVVEAKAEHKDVFAEIDNQCKRYAKSVYEKDMEYAISQWGEYKVPFVFATNGRPYLKQIETKSGVWFLDLRESDNAPKALQNWISPNGLLDLLERDVRKANQTLKDTAYDLLTDPDGLNLYYFQLEAIKAVEQAVLAGEKTALLAMATGTGKTRTALGIIYRFLKSKRFNRILFLVDRNALGEQAQETFQNVKLEDLLTLDKIYNIKNLGDIDIEEETSLHVATVQSMVNRILYNETDTMPSVTDYDLIIVDEAHRGYILDKDIGEDEFLYRDQRDFVSKYRMVIDYYDAVKVALTATPALHTSQIFGKPVYNYTYRRAVLDGFLVDHDAPHIIKTDLSTSGIHFKSGEIVPIYDPVTHEILNSDELEDELDFDIEHFNKQVITESFNQAVLEEIAKDLDPEGQGKTLIFAVNDQHADLIVKILTEIYSELGVSNNAVKKITGSVGGGNKREVLSAIKYFKNEQYPNIAVTVDLLTTGIDVPKITSLVFMRQVKSRILYEQMIGRATRLCPDIEKTHFEIYDPVGVYASLEPQSNMKPIVVDPNTSFIDLLTGVEAVCTKDQIEYQIDLIVAKLQRKKRNLSQKALIQFKALADNQTPDQFISTIKNTPYDKSKAKLNQYKQVFQYLDQEGLNKPNYIVISNKEDKLTEHSRGYGKGVKPDDYLEGFEGFIKDNYNTLSALEIICTRPKELTRQGLTSLYAELDTHGFNEIQLNTAFSELTNQEIAADIISFIRRYSIGATLMNSEERIRGTVRRLKDNHSFNKMELNWLEKIEGTLLKEKIINTETFEMDAFKTAGGFRQVNKKFGSKLEELIDELNDYLYDDGGNVA